MSTEGRVSRDALVPPTSRTLVDQVVSQLRLAIMRGSLPAGEHLVEVRLAAELRVGRSTIREALQRLAASGLVEVVPHRGHRVRAFGDRDATEICEVLGLLEAHAARRLAAPLDPAVATRLRETAGRMASLRFPDDLERFIELDRAFHGMLMEVADQRWLHQAWRSQEPLLGPLLVTLTRRGTGSGTEQAQRHLELVAAAESGDGERLAQACLRHYHLSSSGETPAPLR